MKFSSKLALVAVSSLLSVSAFAVTDMSGLDLGKLDDIAAAELKAPGTSTADGQVALIDQENSGSLAKIQQTGTNNFSVITQMDAASIAGIAQTGNNNLAYIAQASK